MMREGVWIGPLFIHFYGVIIMLGALAAAWLSTIESKRRKINPEYVFDMLPWLLVAGIIGARIWHILTPPASMVERGITAGYYLTHPLEAIAIWNGGLGIPGAVIGGVIALYIYCRKKKFSFATWVDIIAPGLALAQAIGRWGNFVLSTRKSMVRRPACRGRFSSNQPNACRSLSTRPITILCSGMSLSITWRIWLCFCGSGGNSSIVSKLGISF